MKLSSHSPEPPTRPLDHNDNWSSDDMASRAHPPKRRRLPSEPPGSRRHSATRSTSDLVLTEPDSNGSIISYRSGSDLFRPTRVTKALSSGSLTKPTQAEVIGCSGVYGAKRKHALKQKDWKDYESKGLKTLHTPQLSGHRAAHQSWTTTEQHVKSNTANISLSNTTLKKLQSYYYNSDSTHRQQVPEEQHAGRLLSTDSTIETQTLLRPQHEAAQEQYASCTSLPPCLHEDGPASAVEKSDTIGHEPVAIAHLSGGTAIVSSESVRTPVETISDTSITSGFDHKRFSTGKSIGWPTSAEVQPKRFREEDYDDGLDDNDLLDALTAEETTNGEFISLSQTLNPNFEGEGAVIREDIFPHTPLLSGSRRAVQDLDLDSDVDEEFPMDDFDEEDLLRLPDLSTSTQTDQLRVPGLTVRSPSRSFTRCSNPTDPHKRFRSQEDESEINQISTKMQNSKTRNGESTNQVTTTHSHESGSRAYLTPHSDYQSTTPAAKVSSSKSQPTEPTQECRKNTPEHPDYQPLQAFARPEYPSPAAAHSPILGLSSSTFLRVCFRIGEMFKEGKRWSSSGHDAVIQLFARVQSSTREAGTTKQHFVFLDLWSDNPPHPEGVLANYKVTGLADTESKVLLGTGENKMVVCLGRLKRDSRKAVGWTLHLVNIRETDWEEIRYVRCLVSAGAGI